MRRFISQANYRQWLSLICIPVLLIGMTACNSSTVIAYVNVALDATIALAPFIPALAPAVPFLKVAQAGLAGWQPGQPVPQNVIAALQSALAGAEQQFPNITPAQQAEITIIITAIVAALTLAGVLTVSQAKAKMALHIALPIKITKMPTAGELRAKFNAQAAAAGVKPI